MRVGVLTGGGDCPGLNAVIRAIVINGKREGWDILGFNDGWAGVLNNKWEELNEEKVEGIHREGGTILHTSRTNPFKEENGVEKIKDTLNKNKIDCLIAIGGDDTLGVANRLYKEEGIKTIGVPKTIDNDLSATDYTFGFDTAVNIAVEAMDRLHTTAKSHHRVIVVEIMGRHTGWIALEAGVGGGAHIILIPEVPFDIDKVCETLKKRYEEGKTYSIVAVAEGAKAAKGSKFLTREVVKEEKTDAFGNIILGGIARVLEKEIEKRTGFETRSVTLGHIQRGGRPSAFDRFLATRFGVKAVQMVKEEKYGETAALRGTKIVSVPLEEAVGKRKEVPPELYEETVTPFLGK
ncbi:MAG TPA: 6-phosphofructokinase [Candidatus Aerophobetes bacterium]|uniref:Pyrophosphate--fructose 6-phosphate 1-phosphotransferase n=1 Tax=Aerophobetes bacterium TaxID=2030807 RepID=A0A7V0QRV1_UNCAE|nr:6-phosphofructokinase [Candidatus Aerophobetes bacterium]